MENRQALRDPGYSLADRRREEEALRTVRTFHLTREEAVDLIKNLKRKEMLPQSFYFNGSRVWSDWEDE